jgi:cadmium resistance protein CadD (predicted permease)
VKLRRGQEGEGEEEGEQQNARGRYGQVVAVTFVTIANGGDNIAVYTPSFAVRSGIETSVMVAVFALMTAFLWCAIARWLVSHRTIGAPIRRYGHRVLPFVLIGLGILIMFEAGTFEFLSLWS